MGAAPPKEALLIANGKYSHFAGLAHPGPDAAKLGAALEQLGFRVRTVSDANREQMLDAIAEFERGLRNTGAIAFFHYGGHGVQVDGKNYLLPADADIPDERRVATRAVALDEVMTAMDAAAAWASIIVIDACRDNPLPAGSGRNLTRGLSVVGLKPKNSIVIYAAEAGSKALDGLFTPILASALQEKGKTIDQVMKRVRSEVYAKSSGQQTPGEYNQLFEELILGESEESDFSIEDSHNIKQALKPKSESTIFTFLPASSPTPDPQSEKLNQKLLSTHSYAPLSKTLSPLPALKYVLNGEKKQIAVNWQIRVCSAPNSGSKDSGYIGAGNHTILLTDMRYQEEVVWFGRRELIDWIMIEANGIQGWVQENDLKFK